MCVTLTILHHPTVFLTLSLAVELVAVPLAVALLVGEAEASGRVKGPDRGLAGAGAGSHGKPARCWGSD